MNAILSRPALDAMSFFIAASPCEALPNNPFALYRPVVPVIGGCPRRWMFPESHQNVAQIPEFVTAFGERIFSAYWK